MIFSALFNKITNWKNNEEGPLKISGISKNEWPFFFQNFTTLHKELSHLIICPTVEEAEHFYESIRSFTSREESHLFIGLEESPYSSYISSEQSLFRRFNILSNLISNPQRSIVVTTAEAFKLKMPPIEFFQKYNLSLQASDIVSPESLAEKLVALGYSFSTTVEEPGTFSKRGEIFDIYPINHPPIRISYFDDMIESIFAIDLETNKTVRSTEYEKVLIFPTPHILTNETFRNTLASNIKRATPAQKEKFELRKKIISNLSNNILFEDYPSYCSLFFETNNTLIDFFISKPLITVVDEFNTHKNLTELYEDLRLDYEREDNDPNSLNLLPSPDLIYSLNDSNLFSTQKFISVNDVFISTDIDINLSNHIKLDLEKTSVFLKRYVNPTQQKFEYIKSVLGFLKDYFQNEGKIIICISHENSKREIEYLIEENNFNTNLKSRIHFVHNKLANGFYYHAEKVLVICDSDLFTKKISKTKKVTKKNIDLFAEQLSTLKVGDFVIHNDHGIGEYKGLETMELAGNKTDFLVIEYASSDKIYVPVYKLNLIQKHADSTAGLKPASLRSNKFTNLKDKAKTSAKKLAFDLLKLQAERQSSQAFAFSTYNHTDEEFALDFQFEETNDQSLAITDVLNAMQKPVPMDHLVCGDVGFGKTEVAMRAAFKAVNDGKQVAILVPTTILALQHYNSFVSRFKNFAVNIEFLSRFKSAAQVKDIKLELELGKIDIIVGTHKLLSDSIKYKDLGLVIVDEEQRFGVGHKEKLKLLKSSVDFLTLTATPIPRTLQLAFLGLRDLSLIQTAPPKRQSIKTYLIKQDDTTIQAAIKKELARGGQVFYVHNRVNDIDEFAGKIRELVPEARIVVAHGQMSEKELETKIKDFYAGKYQILLSTTIIESGIDIPNANTMIVDRADTYGLSQLHQLRGRIGRSDKKAYAYFVIPNKNLSTVAEARLKALQTYADMGSGFSIASADLEIRGAGDILGATQSGHIEAVGLELYMELLKEAIYELRGEKKVIKKDIEINTPFNAYIPNHYIADSAERLKYYKKLSNCDATDKLEKMREEFVDIFGIYPQEIQNLFTVLETRIILQNLGLKAINVAGKIITLQFDRQVLEKNQILSSCIVEFFMKRPKVYQFTPDYRVIYTHKEKVDQKELLNFAKNVAEQLVPC